MDSASYPLISALDALTGALFLLTAIGVVATRQVLASLQLFILQSLLLSRFRPSCSGSLWVRPIFLRLEQSQSPLRP